MDTLNREGTAHVPRIESALRKQGADTSNDHANDTAESGIKQSAKRIIVGGAVWGLLPGGFASWRLRRLGLVSE